MNDELSVKDATEAGDHYHPTRGINVVQHMKDKDEIVIETARILRIQNHDRVVLANNFNSFISSRVNPSHAVD